MKNVLATAEWYQLKNANWRATSIDELWPAVQTTQWFIQDKDAILSAAPRRAAHISESCGPAAERGRRYERDWWQSLCSWHHWEKMMKWCCSTGKKIKQLQTFLCQTRNEDAVTTITHTHHPNSRISCPTMAHKRHSSWVATLTHAHYCDYNQWRHLQRSWQVCDTVQNHCEIQRHCGEARGIPSEKLICCTPVFQSLSGPSTERQAIIPQRVKGGTQKSRKSLSSFLPILCTYGWTQSCRAPALASLVCCA